MFRSRGPLRNLLGAARALVETQELGRGLTKGTWGQAARFGFVGLIATGVDFALLMLLVELAGWGCFAAATCSFLISTACNYPASMRYVFRRREDMGRMCEASTFLALSLAGLMLNDACMYVLVAGGIDYLMAKVAATALVMAWNFGSRKALLDAGG